MHRNVNDDHVVSANNTTRAQNYLDGYSDTFLDTCQSRQHMCFCIMIIQGPGALWPKTAWDGSWQPLQQQRNCTMFKRSSIMMRKHALATVVNNVKCYNQSNNLCSVPAQSISEAIDSVFFIATYDPVGFLSYNRHHRGLLEPQETSVCRSLWTRLRSVCVTKMRETPRCQAECT